MTPPQPPAPRRPAGRLATGAALAVAGLLVWILAGVTARHEPRSYQAQSSPPQFVALHAGATYSLGTTGGLEALERVVSPSALRCTLTPRDGAESSLAVTPESSDKALHRIATFVAPVSGDVHVACPDAGVVYVDDADGTTDWAGLLRVLATLLLTIGLPLALSGLAGRSVDAVAAR